MVEVSEEEYKEMFPKLYELITSKDKEANILAYHIAPCPEIYFFLAHRKIIFSRLGLLDQWLEFRKNYDSDDFPSKILIPEEIYENYKRANGSSIS